MCFPRIHLHLCFFIAPGTEQIVNISQLETLNPGGVDRHLFVKNLRQYSYNISAYTTVHNTLSYHEITEMKLSSTTNRRNTLRLLYVLFPPNLTFRKMY